MELVYKLILEKSLLNMVQLSPNYFEWEDYPYQNIQIDKAEEIVIKYGSNLLKEVSIGSSEENTYTLSNGNYMKVTTTANEPASGYLDTKWYLVNVQFYKKDGTYLGAIGSDSSIGDYWTNPAYMIGFVIDDDEQTARIGYLLTPVRKNQNEIDEYGRYKWYSRASEQLTESLLYEWLSGSEDDDSNPYPKDDDDDNGGGGEQNDDDDDIPIPPLPTEGVTDSGFISLYTPNMQQIKNLASYMWSTTFNLDNFKKLFSDPMDAILGLVMIPVNVPAGTSKNVKIGNLDTNIPMNTVARQYVEIDCGSLDIKEYWASYLDYSPYTKAEIYLPYIGSRTLNIDDIMKKTVRVVYHVNVLDGSCVAYIKCGKSVLYEFIGSCVSHVPITNADMSSAVRNAITSATVIVGGAIAGGAVAGTAAGTATASAGVIGATSAPSVGSLMGGATLSSLASSVMGSKVDVNKSGSMSGSAGILGTQKPFIIITRPNISVADKQNKLTGYPSNYTVTLNSLKGYTQVQSIHLENISATDEEKQEIEMLLKSGVII